MGYKTKAVKSESGGTFSMCRGGSARFHRAATAGVVCRGQAICYPNPIVRRWRRSDPFQPKKFPMALDAYGPCPCGSGKKFKWCCQPIAAQIERAFEQESQGQHEAALRILDEVIAQNPANPEPLGRKAQILYENHRLEEAEATLQKALDISPKYPFGYLLRGLFRQNEGEIPGALMLYRKAAEYYDPEARDILGQVYAHIGESELKMNRPVAARAALQIAGRLLPGDESLRQSFDAIFGDQSALPASARREYTFQSLPADAPEGRRQAWAKALAGAGSGKLGEAVAA